MISILISIEECMIVCWFSATPVHNFCTPTKFKLCVANSLDTVHKEPRLLRLLTYQGSNLMSIFRC
jgi:hypothetical protein